MELKPGLGHVHTRPDELNTLQLEQIPLVQPGFTLEEDSTAPSEDTLPGYTACRHAPQSPGHLTCEARVSGCERYLAVSCNLSPWNLNDGAPDVIKTTHV